MVIGPNTSCLIDSKWYHVNQVDTAQKIVKVQDKKGVEHLFDLERVAVFVDRHTSNSNNTNIIREVNRS